MKTLQERIFDKISFTESGCCLWVGGRSSNGYGHLEIKGKTKLAHRVVYEMFVEQIPDGSQIDHICRVRNCVNPNHLEHVSAQENSARRSRLITTCPQGHEYTKENVYLHKNMRHCKKCTKIIDKMRNKKRYQ